LDALRTLAGEGKPSAATLKTLDQLASDIDADVRTLTAALIAKHDPKRAAGLLAGYLTDKPTFARVVGGGVKPADVVKPAAANPHQQSVALQPLVAAKDVPTLGAVAIRRRPSRPVWGPSRGWGSWRSRRRRRCSSRSAGPTGTTRRCGRRRGAPCGGQSERGRK
jgi:hypothetical protein